MRMAGRAMILGLAAVAMIALSASPAWDHPKRQHAEEAKPSPSPDKDPRAEKKQRAVRLTLTAPRRAQLGDGVTLRARLVDGEGQPIDGATIIFLSPASWGIHYEGEMVLGRGVTDRSGWGEIEFEARRSREIAVVARFEGDEEHASGKARRSIEVIGDAQLYTPTAGIRLPGAGAWMVAIVLALVWGLYLVVSARVLAIAHSSWVQDTAGGVACPARRKFLQHALPVGMGAAIGGLGSGLLALIWRSPRTHAHLVASRDAVQGYKRTPLSVVGAGAPMQPIPSPLDREVSFAGEIQPLLLMKGGPHAVVPENQPPPAGVRLDNYEHIMAREGLVVPGEPEESELVTVLLDPAMQMPPVGLALPEEEIRLIVTWVAQGAKNN